MNGGPPLHRWLPALVLVLLLAGCRVEASVVIDVARGGSGEVAVEVRLDEEAAQRLGGPERLRLEDVRAAGWRVEGPADTGDGGLVVTATKPFASAAALQPLLDEVAEGVFTDTEVTLEDGFGEVRQAVRTTVALTGDPAQFGDDALTAVLDGLPLARTPEELAAEGADDPDAFTLRVEGRSLGSTVEVGPLSATGEPSTTTLEVRGVETNRMPFLLIGLGVFIALASLGALVLRRR